MGERMARVENEVKNLKEQNTVDHRELKVMLQDFLESAPSLFASKLTEKIVYTLCAVILVAVITALVALVVF